MKKTTKKNPKPGESNGKLNLSTRTCTARLKLNDLVLPQAFVVFSILATWSKKINIDSFTQTYKAMWLNKCTLRQRAQWQSECKTLLCQIMWINLRVTTNYAYVGPIHASQKGKFSLHERWGIERYLNLQI